jgi:hypothetical protein
LVCAFPWQDTQWDPQLRPGVLEFGWALKTRQIYCQREDQCFLILEQMQKSGQIRSQEQTEIP